MGSSKQSLVRRLLSESSGAEIAEAAAVLPLMFMILLGIFWFGQAFSIYGAITRAAQEGARAGATRACTTCTPSATTSAQQAVAAVQNALNASKLDPTKAQSPSTAPSFTSCRAASTSCDSGSSSICVQASVQMTDPASGGTGECGIAVTFQYPFQFWLPFASLNKQQIWMTASARVRMENQ